MAESNQIREIIFAAIDEFNYSAPEEQQLDKSTETILSGENGKLDSLGLVNFIVAVEEKIEEELGSLVSLANEEALMGNSNPFETIESLFRHIVNLLKE